MKLSEMIEQVRLVCRTRATWIARFGRHVSRCAEMSREDRVRTITSPLDVLPAPLNVVRFETGRRAA